MDMWKGHLCGGSFQILKKEKGEMSRDKGHRDISPDKKPKPLTKKERKERKKNRKEKHHK